MNYIFAVSALAVSLLAGCGKTIPECGDPRVQAMLIKLVKESVTPDVLNSMKEEIPGAVNPPGRVDLLEHRERNYGCQPGCRGIFKHENR